MQTVLLVEDQPEVRGVLAKMLRRLGFTVLTAADGDQAVAVSQSHAGAIHLMLTDVIMPGMSATELSRQIGAERLGLRTIYMSGYPEDMLHQRLSNGDVSTVLVKPFDQSQLGDAIERLIGPSERQAG